MSCFIMLLALLFCGVPSLAEESIHERMELTEEAVLLVTIKKQGAREYLEPQPVDFIPLRLEDVDTVSAFLPAIKRYILFSSLRLCD